VPRVALALAVLSCLAAASMLLPGPTWGLWLVHAVLLEASLGVTLVALLALVLARRGQASGRSVRWAPRFALVAAAVGLLPFAAAAPLYIGREARFSIGEYVVGFEGPGARVEKDVDLGAGGLRADLYRGPGRGPSPLVVVIHGGSWQRGDKGDAPHVSRALAGAGFVVADVQYRLAPRHRFPDGVADVKCLVGRLRERAAGLAVDSSRIALLGRSAGGQVALVAAYSMGDPRIPPSCEVAESPVQAVVSLYAPTDLAWGHDNPPFPDPIDGPGSIETYLGGPPLAEPDAYRLASPLTWSDRPLPPTLLIHGTADRLVRADHARRLASGLHAAGRPLEALIIPMAEHGFDRRPGGVGEQLARAAILRFLAGVEGSARLTRPRGDAGWLPRERRRASVWPAAAAALP
jgi:acetyl esterase/lipase